MEVGPWYTSHELLFVNQQASEEVTDGVRVVSRIFVRLTPATARISTAPIPRQRSGRRHCHGKESMDRLRHTKVPGYGLGDRQLRLGTTQDCDSRVGEWPHPDSNLQSRWVTVQQDYFKPALSVLHQTDIRCPSSPPRLFSLSNILVQPLPSSCALASHFRPKHVHLEINLLGV